MPGVPGGEQQDQRAIVFFVILLFIFLTPDQTPRRRLSFGSDLLQDERQRDFDVLANTTYGQFGTDATDGPWLNLTGFREDDGYHWEALPSARAMSFDQRWDPTIPTGTDEFPFYDEITGEIKGDFKFSSRSVTWPTNINLTALDPGKEYILHHFQRNITEQEGEITLALADDESSSRAAREIKAEMGLWVESAPGTGWQMNMRGVHFPDGSAILATVSSKFDSLPALPHFALDEESFEAARPVMNKTVAQLWEKALYRDTDILAVPRCELIVWLQPKPLLGLQSKSYLRDVEKELIAPQGLPIGTPPLMSFSAIVFSPDCGYILEAESLTGAKTEAFAKLSRRLLLAFVITLGLQIALLRRQVMKAATPSTRSRIAYQGIILAALGDGLILFLMLGLLISDGTGFLVVAAAFFLSCMHVAFLEVKFVFDIWHVQVGEPLRAEAERQRRARQQQQAQQPVPAAPQTTPPSDNPVSAALPGTAATTTNNTNNTTTRTADTGAAPTPTPLFMPSDQDSLLPVTEPGTARPPGGNPTNLTIPEPPPTFATIYYRFYLTLVFLLFLSLWATTWPRPLRSGYMNVLAFLYFSIWLPQIRRNALRNCRKALSWEYVLGSSLLRALPVLYWYVADRNLLGVNTSPRAAALLAGWLALQIAVLVSQQWLGPRLLVPEKWCPEAYEYHPVLVEGGDVEGGTGTGRDTVNDAGAGTGGTTAAKGLDISLLASASEAKDKDGGQRRCFDCAICMNEIDVPVVAANRDGQNTRSKGTGSAGKGLLGMGMGMGMERANYMVTPCRHIFHAECLEGWMGLRLVCPVCREGLPPL